jgi:ComF family protein
MHPIRSIRTVAQSINRAFLNVLAPRHCELCGRHMSDFNSRFEFACNICTDSLTPAPYPDEIMNRLIARFTGDTLSVSSAAALYTLTDEPPLHNLFYALKYRGRSSIGVEFGRELGEVLHLLDCTGYNAILPVPIHRARQLERGYNQAEEIARGIGEVLRVSTAPDWLVRNRYTQSQTTMNAIARRTNVLGAFTGGKQAERIRGTAILLVDDVLTTGSTLNACATTLLELGARRVDVATLAVA